MKPGRRVNGFARYPDLKMEVRPGRLARGAHGPDLLAALDGLAGRHVDRRQVTVAGRVAAPMVDEHVVAVPAVPLGHDDGARGGGRDRRSAGRRDVEALMELRAPAEGVGAPAERGGDRSRHRPGEAAARALTLGAAGDSGGALLRLELPLALEDQSFELGFFGGGEALDLGDLGSHAMAPLGGELDEISPLAGE